MAVHRLPDEVDLDDFSFNDETGVYSYECRCLHCCVHALNVFASRVCALCVLIFLLVLLCSVAIGSGAPLTTSTCRCSAHFTITDDELDRGVELLSCPGCSLDICVLYE